MCIHDTPTSMDAEALPTISGSDSPFQEVERRGCPSQHDPQCGPYHVRGG